MYLPHHPIKISQYSARKPKKWLTCFPYKHNNGAKGWLILLLQSTIEIPMHKKTSDLLNFNVLSTLRMITSIYRIDITYMVDLS